MTPNQESILSRYGISKPPEWTGMSGQGADTMYSVGGKWLKAGQKHPSGYTVGQYDPKSKALGMSIYGVNLPVGMKSSTIQNFEAPYNPYEDPSLMLFADKSKQLMTLRDKISKMKGSMSDEDQKVLNQYTELNKQDEPDFGNMPLDKIAEHQKYNVGDESFQQMYKNLVSAGQLGDSELSNVMTLKEYDKRMKNNELKPETKYYIPTSDGQLDVFMTRNKPDYQ